MNPTPASMHLFTPPTERLLIGTVDGKLVEVAAQYNPKELSIQAQAKWDAVNGNGKKMGGSQALSWSGTEPQIITAELLFDGVEEDVSIRPLIDTLISLTEPRDLASRHDWERRPPLCVAVWGVDKQFRCVVQSVQTKITTFAKDGRPLRAVCTVTLKEANVTAMWDADDKRGGHEADVQDRERILRNASRDLPLE